MFCLPVLSSLTNHALDSRTLSLAPHDSNIAWDLRGNRYSVNPKFGLYTSTNKWNKTRSGHKKARCWGYSFLLLLNLFVSSALVSRPGSRPQSYLLQLGQGKGDLQWFHISKSIISWHPWIKILFVIKPFLARAKRSLTVPSFKALAVLFPEFPKFRLYETTKCSSPLGVRVISSMTSWAYWYVWYGPCSRARLSQ